MVSARLVFRPRCAETAGTSAEEPLVQQNSDGDRRDGPDHFHEPELKDRLRDVDDVMPYVQVGHTTSHSSAGWPAGADLHRDRHTQ